MPERKTQESEYGFLLDLIPKNLQDKFKQKEGDYFRQLSYFASNMEKYGIKEEYVPELKIFIYLKIIYEVVVLPAYMLNEVISFSKQLRIDNVKIGSYETNEESKRRLYHLNREFMEIITILGMDPRLLSISDFNFFIRKYIEIKNENQT